jgi:hypothetical protein
LLAVISALLWWLQVLESRSNEQAWQAMNKPAASGATTSAVAAARVASYLAAHPWVNSTEPTIADVRPNIRSGNLVCEEDDGWFEEWEFIDPVTDGAAWISVLRGHLEVFYFNDHGERVTQCSFTPCDTIQSLRNDLATVLLLAWCWQMWIFARRRRFRDRDERLRFGRTITAIALLMACNRLGSGAYLQSLVPIALSLVIWTVVRLIKPRAIRTENHCGKCSYNLTANISGVCPECGAPIPSQERQQMSMAW